MTAAPRQVVFPSVGLAARVTTLLARTFPEYGPGAGRGFRVMSHDHREPRRMFVRWYGDEPTRPFWTHGPQLGIEGYRVQIAEALTRDGYAVTLVPGNWDVYVADRPVDTSGARYAAVRSDVPLGDQWLVMDQWTRVHAASSDTEEEAAAEARRLDRALVLTDARMVTAAELWSYLEQADALLGDGMWWLYREVHDVALYSTPVRHERIDALTDVANALRRGVEVGQAGRLVGYETPYRGTARPGLYNVHWVPESDAPAVGYYPNPEWARSPHQDAAIAVLTAAGLAPVRFGADIGIGGYMCESEGFMVSARDMTDAQVPGLMISPAGNSASEQQSRVPEVMRAAGWRVEEEQDWPETWTVFPPKEG